VKLRDDLRATFRTQLDARTADGKTAFPRDPLFASCTVGDGNSNDVEFIIIVVHLKAFGDAQSQARRRLASEKLTEIVQQLRAAGASVVLGGDFNERLDTSILQNLKESPDLFSMTADDASGDAISFVGASHRSLIDHILVSNDVDLGVIDNDDAAIVRLDKSVRDFADRVSDHVPIVFRMVLRPAVIDLPQPGEDGAVEIPIPDRAASVKLGFKLN
jgi:endonuclease/exonuclease/phosphatase family metal-dependent hydrolase